MHVRHERINLDALVEGVALPHLLVFSPRWDFEEVIGDVNAVQGVLRRL
jgi:hypothetical protein